MAAVAAGAAPRAAPGRLGAARGRPRAAPGLELELTARGSVAAYQSRQSSSSKYGRPAWSGARPASSGDRPASSGEELGGDKLAGWLEEVSEGESDDAGPPPTSPATSGPVATALVRSEPASSDAEPASSGEEPVWRARGGPTPPTGTPADAFLQDKVDKIKARLVVARLDVARKSSLLMHVLVMGTWETN